MDIRNGITRQWLFSRKEQATNRMPLTSGMTQEAKARRNVRDTLT